MKRRYANAAVKRTFPVIGFVVSLLVVTIAAGCSSKSQSKSTGEQGEKGKTAQNAAAGQSSSNPGIDLQCVMDRIQNPSESFHYLYKKDSTNPVHQEADVTPQSIDGFRVDVSGEQHALHAQRSDPQSWQSAWTGLMGISG